VFNPADGHVYDVFLSAGPKPLNAAGRSEDLASHSGNGLDRETMF
jgi:hypothetical protein